MQPQTKKAKAATSSAVVTLVAADDGSAHTVPRAAALDASELLADLLGDDPAGGAEDTTCLLYTSPSPRDATLSRMPSSA